MAKAKQHGVWGIDVGQCALKAVRLEMVEGKLTATAFDYVEHAKILSQPDADADQLTREALEKFLARNVLRGDVVAISVPGQGGLARFVKLPPVEEKKIGDIVRFEAKQQIPFRLEEVVWDYQKIGSGTVTDGFAMETEIGLFAMKRDMVNRYLQHFKDVKVEVHICQLAPLALCNFLSYDLLQKGEGEKAEEESGGEEAAGKKRCLVALDIGADSSNLVITDADRIIWQRPIPLGGNHFTRALTKDFKLTFAKAEHLKRNAIKSPELKKILASLKPVLNDFVGEVQRSLGYFTNTHRDAHVLYMVGLGNAFRLPGLQKFLSEKLQMDVRKLAKLEKLSGDSVVTAPQYTENVLSFAVAYGLALQGLKVARLHTNLLPQEIQMERMVRAKKPFAAAAAAALLVGVGGLALFLAFLKTLFDDPKVKDWETKSVKSVEVASKWKADCQAVVSQIQKKAKETFQIASGQAEKLNWSLLLQYINEALPQPDGTHIAEKFWKSYKTERAQTANAFLEKGLAPGNSLQQDLTQVNIEAILPLYTDDLEKYFLALGNDPAMKANGLEGMPQEEADMVRAAKDSKDLPKKGWVIELRGFTYFKPVGEDNERLEPRQFLKDTICYNLAAGKNLADKVKYEALLKTEKEKKELTADEKKKYDALKAKEAESKEFTAEEKQEFERLKKKETENKALTSKQKLWKLRYETIWQKPKFVVLFKYAAVDNPTPGTFRWINNTLLKPLIEGEDKKDGEKGNMPTGGPTKSNNATTSAEGEEAKPKVDRSGWKPVGEFTAPTYVGGKEAAGTEKKGKGNLQRFEFAIFFVWEEPLKSELDAETAGGGQK
jgi:type IV pilus assembly protein PilM